MTSCIYTYMDFVCFPSFDKIVAFISQSDIIDYDSYTNRKATNEGSFFGHKDTSPLNTSPDSSGSKKFTELPTD